jgi:predicted nucleotidyltransferase
VHILPVEAVISLEPPEETIEISAIQESLELDLVTHDIKKFFSLLLRKNGYVLEQLYSPLIVFSRPEHDELKNIARGCITRYHNHHYKGFAQTQWGLFQKECRVKPLLYTYRVLLTGIHLMRTGEIEANLVRLNAIYCLPQIPDLIERKLSGAEKSYLGDADMAFHQGEYERLCQELEQAHNDSHLPEEPTCRAALNDLLVRLRLCNFA